MKIMVCNEKEVHMLLAQEMEVNSEMPQTTVNIPMELLNRWKSSSIL
jgi:hypothetical protein